MLIRERAEADAEDCLDLLVQVHNADGYPRYVPEGLQQFLAPPYETAAWVAEIGGAVVGHVGLHQAAVDPTLEAAQRATDLPPEGLAVVARLLVSPAVRRRGVGRALLAHATDHARAAGQRAVLDVTQDAPAAIALYEAAGWLRLEQLTLNLDGKPLLLWVYLSPQAPTAASRS